MFTDNDAGDRMVPTAKIHRSEREILTNTKKDISLI